jgi:hypothetical protein
MGTVCLAFTALQNQLIDQLIAVRDQLIAAFWPGRILFVCVVVGT